MSNPGNISQIQTTGDGSLGFFGTAPVAAKAAPTALGALKAGAAGTETEAEFKALYEMVVSLRARLKELGLYS